jgi:hypothetical protein
LTPATCIEKLTEIAPKNVPTACRSPVEEGLPNASGFYAWWIKPGSVPGVPPRPHPTAPKRHLLYVGIAPGRATSRQTIRSRVLNNHLRGNTGSSTFRLSLAALLMEPLRLQPLRKEKKIVLQRDDNSALSEWQRSNLWISWCERDNPWTIEAQVIAAMKPPLNLAGNAAHPFHTTMTAARTRFRAAAV